MPFVSQRIARNHVLARLWFYGVLISMKSYFVESQIPQVRQSTVLPRICTSPSWNPHGGHFKVLRPISLCPSFRRKTTIARAYSTEENRTGGDRRVQTSCFISSLQTPS
jgi:hypothetical protein